MQFGCNIDDETDYSIVQRILSSGLIQNDDKLEFRMGILDEDNQGRLMKLLLKFLSKNVTIKKALCTQDAIESPFIDDSAKIVLKKYLQSKK